MTNSHRRLIQRDATNDFLSRQVRRCEQDKRMPLIEGWDPINKISDNSLMTILR